MCWCFRVQLAPLQSQRQRCFCWVSTRLRRASHHPLPWGGSKLYLFVLEYSWAASKEAWFGGLTLAGWQVPTKSALSLPSLAGQVREKYNKSPMSWGKGRERSLTVYCHGQNRLDLGEIMELITNQNQSRKMRIKTYLKTPTHDQHIEGDD